LWFDGLMKTKNNNNTVSNIQNIEIVHTSLQKIAEGIWVYIIGTLIGTILGFAGRVIVIRYMSQSEYGLFSLALVVMNIFITISTLGLMEGVARYIAFFRGKNEEGKIRNVIYSSIKISLIASIFFTSLIFITSDFISTNIFNISDLSTPLKIFSIGIPFTVLINILISVFRGFDKVAPKVYFLDVARTAVFILLLGGIIFIGLSYINMLYCYLFSIVISSIFCVIYSIKKLPALAFTIKEKIQSNHIGKKLLLFSLPLLAVSTLYLIINWSDTLMLGYYKTPEIVGLYNGAVPLAQLIPLFLLSANFIFVPIVSGLYSKKLISEIGRTYQILTKWIFLLTIPIGLVFILFPEVILDFLFGANYIQAAPALRILSFGFIFNIFLGLNSTSLIVMGRTKFIMYTTLIGAILNVALNIALIPFFGIIGAALASLVAYWITNILNSLKLYKISKIHPFTKNYIKTIIISIVLLSIIYFSSFYINIDFWTLCIILIIFLLFYGFLLLIIKCIDEEDLRLLLTLEKKSGLNLGPIKKILTRFL